MGHVETLIDGKPVPSVTQVIGVLDKPFLYRWYATNGWEKCEAIKKESAERGIALHELTEAALKYKFGLAAVKPPDSEFVAAIEKWTDVLGFVPLHFERHVKSRRHMYGGTFDCLGKIQGELTIVDWKFTGQIADTYILQLAGYAAAHEEETGEEIKSGRVVRPYELKTMAKETGFRDTAEGYKWGFQGSTVYIEERRYTGLHHYFKPFLNCREVWDFINRKGMWEQ